MTGRGAHRLRVGDLALQTRRPGPLDRGRNRGGRRRPVALGGQRRECGDAACYNPPKRAFTKSGAPRMWDTYSPPSSV